MAAPEREHALDHVVVVMFENRSFDHLLGRPYQPGEVESFEGVIGKDLSRNGFIMRYTARDDFGLPETAFLVCQFWYIDALVSLGRMQEARELFSDLLTRRNRFGLLSEDIHPATGELWGNLPQTYSMAGIINTGRILSRSWQEAWAQT